MNKKITFYLLMVLFLMAFTAKGSQVSFHQLLEEPDPTLTITPAFLPVFNAQLGTPAKAITITLSTANLPNALTVDIIGKNANFFRTSVSSVPASATETTIEISYHPTEAGEHQAMLSIECPGTVELTEIITLRGTAVDPAAPPKISFSPTSLPEFKAEVGKEYEQTILVSSENMIDYLNMKVMGEGGGSFRISTSMFLKNQKDSPLKITFRPLAAGEFNERIEFSSKGAKTIYLNVKGTATGGSTDPGTPEGDSFPLDPSHPTVLLNEHFDEVTHNKVLSIDGWKNIALQNTRAWWGYNFKDQNETVIEKAAKVTAFNSLKPEAVPYEMCLITPALDFKNAASKVFTFRVMGDLMIENSDATLELIYMDLMDGELYTSLIELPMPTIPDENKEWREFHVNLEGQEIADVFFMGFGFIATGGTANSAVYYIDDVSFGRTDLPVITSSAQQLILEGGVNQDIFSEEIFISSRNLTEPISISISGANASKFKTSVSTLPAVGGSFLVSFASDILGVHEAYVKIASKGAADVYIPISAKTNLLGLPQTNVKNFVRSENHRLYAETETNAIIKVITLDGVQVYSQSVETGTTELSVQLSPGNYLIQIITNNEARIQKIRML